MDLARVAQIFEPQRLYIVEQGPVVAAAMGLRMPLAPDSVTSAKLFVVAPGAGPARQDFTIAVRALDDDPRGDRETIQFDRPGTEP